jgi:hypothetical protein
LVYLSVWRDETGRPQQKYKEYHGAYQPGGYGPPQKIVFKEMLSPYGDDPHDQEMIKEGFKYYDKGQ